MVVLQICILTYTLQKLTHQVLRLYMEQYRMVSHDSYTCTTASIKFVWRELYILTFCTCKIDIQCRDILV